MKVVGTGEQVQPMLALKSVAVMPWGRKSVTVTGATVAPDAVEVTPVLPTVMV